MNKSNWSVVAVFGIVVLVAFVVGASLLGGWGSRAWGMSGPGMMGGWGFGAFGWIGMLFMWLIPLAVIGLIVLGVAGLVRSVGGGSNPVAPARACPSCGRAVQADWRNCPHCGAALTPTSATAS